MSTRSASRHSRERPIAAVAVCAAVAISAAVVIATGAGWAGAAGNGAPTDAAATASIYPASTVPAVSADKDSRSVEVGVRFSATVPGVITQIRYYKAKSNTGTHVGTLWSSTGQRLATTKFTSESATGWQTASLSQPVTVVPGTTYVASYHADNGHYASRENAFAPGKTVGQSYVKASAGVYSYGATSFPGVIWHGSEYYVDISFRSTPGPVLGGAAATPPPTSTPSSPAPKPTTSAPTAKPSTSKPSTTTPTTTTTSTAAPTTTAPSTTTPTSTPPATTGNFTTHPQAGVPAGTALTAYTGPTTITKDGTVIDAKTITQSLEISAKNVVISRSVFHSGGGEAIHVSGSATITDTTVSGGENGIGGDNYTATRVEVTNLSDDGFKLGNNVHVDQSWCHDMTPTTQAHADCGQMQAGVTNMSVTNSWFDGGRNSALFLAPDLGPSSNGPVLINNNVLGNGNYSLYCVDGNNGEYIVKNITITNNRFLRLSNYGPATVNVPVTASNNTWFDTGKSIGSNLNP
ncbi:DUF4082 domain-containing protein [Jatrophihabitans sp. DSM 45814]